MHDFGATRVNSSIHTGATRASKASTHMIAHQTEVLFIKTGEAISIGCGVAYVTSDNQSRHAAYAVVSLDRAVVTSTQSGGLRCDRVFLHPCQNPTQIFMNDDMKWQFFRLITLLCLAVSQFVRACILFQSTTNMFRANFRYRKSKAEDQCARFSPAGMSLRPWKCIV